MRLLLAAILIAALGWSAYWWQGARAVDRDMTAWFDARHNAGWVANATGVDTRGFPNRFDTTVKDLELADPATGIAWSAPFFQILRLSYQPRHVIAIWPSEQQFAIPGETMTLTTQDAKGSFVFGDDDTWSLERASVVVETLGIVSDAGWTAQLADLRFAAEPSEKVPDAMRVGLQANGLRPASPALAQLAERNILPGEIQRLSLDTSITFEAPWDRNAIEQQRPNITAVDLHLLQTNWGQLEFWAAGAVTVDELGRLTGSITLKVKNWRDLLAFAKSAGWLSDGMIGPLETGLTLLAGLAGSNKTLDAPLTFNNGRMSFGPIPLGDAPRLTIR